MSHIESWCSDSATSHAIQCPGSDRTMWRAAPSSCTALSNLNSRSLWRIKSATCSSCELATPDALACHHWQNWRCQSCHQNQNWKLKTLLLLLFFSGAFVGLMTCFAALVFGVGCSTGTHTTLPSSSPDEGGGRAFVLAIAPATFFILPHGSFVWAVSTRSSHSLSDGWSDTSPSEDESTTISSISSSSRFWWLFGWQLELLSHNSSPASQPANVDLNILNIDWLIDIMNEWNKVIDLTFNKIYYYNLN